jgi:hypothetical protein
MDAMTPFFEANDLRRNIDEIEAVAEYTFTI